MFHCTVLVITTLSHWIVLYDIPVPEEVELVPAQQNNMTRILYACPIRAGRGAGGKMCYTGYSTVYGEDTQNWPLLCIEHTRCITESAYHTTKGQASEYERPRAACRSAISGGRYIRRSS